MKKNILISILIIFSIYLIFVFLTKNYYKIGKYGNTTNNKTLNDVQNYILNITSYSAQIEVTINSNKNTNKYLMNQEYIVDNYSKQELIEPENIRGLTTIYNGKNLEILNSKLNISKLYENYEYISDNILWLSEFVLEYKKTNNKNITETKNEYIIEIKVNKNKYITYQTLYINKSTNKPVKLLIEDNNKKNTISILYKEIKIN